MSLSKTNLIFLSFFVFITLHCTEAINGDEGLTYSTCKHTLCVSECISSLRSDAKSETADLQELTDIAFNLSRVYGGSKTLDYIADLKAKSEGNDSLSSCLSDCIEQYSDAEENLEEAIEALKVRSFDDLKTLVSSAMIDSDTGEEGFREMMNESLNGLSAFADRNQDFSILCSNFLAIASLLFS